MVEATDVDGSRPATVDQFQRGHRLVGEAQNCGTSTVVERDAAELPVAQGGVEVERSLQVRDAVGDEEGLHAATPSLLEQAVRPGVVIDPRSLSMVIDHGPGAAGGR